MEFEQVLFEQPAMLLIIGEQGMYFLKTKKPKNLFTSCELRFWAFYYLTNFKVY
jgi:hypothetical protein